MFYTAQNSPRFIGAHAQDNYTDLGFDYRGNIFKKTLSKIILNNKVNSAILSKIEPIIVMLIDTVKQIKLQYMISLDKNDRNLN